MAYFWGKLELGSTSFGLSVFLTECHERKRMKEMKLETGLAPASFFGL